MARTLTAPQTAAECAAQEATLVLDRLTAADVMGIGQSILALALGGLELWNSQRVASGGPG